jgi:RNA polymerase sigma-70 factor, ECF subfamily
MSTSPSPLLDSCATGSVRSFDKGALLKELYSVHCAAVWRSLRRFGVPESCVEDAAQDVFLNVYRRLDTFEGRAAIGTWVYGIALRVARDYRRSKMRRDKREALAVAQRAGQEPVEGPPEMLARREANRLLHEILSRLPDDQREVFVLAELEGLDVREVAQVVGLQLRTCQRRLKAARACFESRLDAQRRMHQREST